jgi:hypothetical protein
MLPLDFVNFFANGKFQLPGGEISVGGETPEEIIARLKKIHAQAAAMGGTTPDQMPSLGTFTDMADSFKPRAGGTATTSASVPTNPDWSQDEFYKRQSYLNSVKAMQEAAHYGGDSRYANPGAAALMMENAGRFSSQIPEYDLKQEQAGEARAKSALDTLKLGLEPDESKARIRRDNALARYNEERPTDHPPGLDRSGIELQRALDEELKQKRYYSTLQSEFSMLSPEKAERRTYLASEMKKVEANLGVLKNRISLLGSSSQQGSPQAGGKSVRGMIGTDGEMSPEEFARVQAEVARMKAAGIL